MKRWMTLHALASYAAFAAGWLAEWLIHSHGALSAPALGRVVAFALAPAVVPLSFILGVLAASHSSRAAAGLAILAAAYGVALVVLARLHRRFAPTPDPAAPRCSRCGYDLRATSPADPCPECGRLGRGEQLVEYAPRDGGLR